jgi:lipoprotein-releasing system permease protein
MYEYDMKYCYALLSEVQDFFGRPDEITGLEVKVKDISNSKVTAKALARLLKDDQYRVRDWREINKGLFSALKLERMVMFVLLCLLVFVAAFGIVSTLMMMVQEKGKEIAVLKALGVSTLSVVRVFITEGLFLGGIGTILGLFMGFLSCIFIEKYGIALDPEVYYINQLPVEMDIKEFIKIAVSAISISLLATIYPALQAARVRPTEGLRYE